MRRGGGPGGRAADVLHGRHPPPLLIPSGGQARYVPSTGGGPLGTGSRFPLAEARLGLGDHLLLYTNGIIDRPGVGRRAAPWSSRGPPPTSPPAGRCARNGSPPSTG
ncbi:serine/threonine-protein phosphatase [Actinomadura madurae]|nr:SpoIIE family protein phosphatase [Actinomadura madurae]MCQ0009375.1 serine/threonine-protein phosphatase [Actinomadura madurae]